MLVALILAAGVANLNLSVANVALPTIGREFDASQTMLNLIAVGFSLGLAASVLYLGALGDRYGRKTMLLLGMVLSIPACLVAALAPSATVLLLARIVGGLAAGMAFPTTLALITALWSGPSRTRAIALWSGLGGAISALGPLASGGLLEVASWRWVFLMTLPLAVVALLLVWRAVPAHVGETTDPVDHLGGVLSMLVVAALVLAINLAAVPDIGAVPWVTGAIAVIGGVLFAIRQWRTAHPVYDLHLAVRPTFWVAGLAGVIVFGSLMGAMYVGQLFLQNVLGYDALEAGASILPAAVLMVVMAPVSGRMLLRHGSRLTLLAGFVISVLGFASMLAFWDVGVGFWAVALGYGLIGLGVGLAATPASQSLTASVPVDRVGMASGTADLQRDLGGAVMQSVLGAILAAGYTAAITRQITAAGDASTTVQADLTTQIEGQLQRSFDGAVQIAEQAPQYADQIIAAARESFLDGADWAYGVGVLATVVGAVLVWWKYPSHARERALLAEYAGQRKTG